MIIDKVVSIGKVADIVQKFKNQGKKTVLVGGCFDILHPGHVIFLEKAKQAGDYLVVLLESDEKVKKLKGSKRPIHTQQMRALVLSALQAVDYVVLLPFTESEAAYDQLMEKIQPDIVAATMGYTNADHHKRTTKLIGAQFKYVTGVIGNHSTSRILNGAHED